MAMWESIKIKLGIVFFAMMPVFFLSHLGPGLWDDLMLKRTGLMQAEQARVYSAWCKPSQVIFSTCSIRIEVEGQGRPIELEFTAMAGYLGKYQPKALRSDTNPMRFTTSLNIEALWSRFFAFALLVGATTWLFGLMARPRRYPDLSAAHSEPT